MLNFLFKDEYYVHNRTVLAVAGGNGGGGGG